MIAACMALIDEPSDKEKFMEIYNTYNKMMFKVAMSVLHNRSLADETVQDCFLKIAVNIDLMPDVRSKKTRALIIIMVRNKSLNNLKAEHYDKTEPLSETEDVTSDTINNVLSEIGYKRLVEEISGLDDIYKDILTLRFICDYSIDEICSLLDISKGTAGSRISRGRKILIERLEGANYD